ncbi:MAG TPA: prepilin-type N-terminal cleavage/methylation domain-containing protein [Tepidisphaeraceae bacterium]|nr:prepilin-type N-terminal cleavage/methylation domain-containing protein [Tepidisphaeraceae bacterium]
MQQSRRHHRILSRQAAGFTLVELMVSIVMVLMIIVGVNAVFQAASKTTGTGMAVEEMTRSMRSTERLFTRDFSHAVPAWEMPFLTIFSMQQFAFRNRADMNNDPDGNPHTMDVNNDGNENNTNLGEYIHPFIYNDRNHRVDRIGFFARDSANPFECQTGNLVPTNSSDPIPLISPDKSEEAYVWYGHLRLPTMPPKANKDIQMRGGLYYDPGWGNAQDNLKNFFSDDWCFGRAAILLKDFGNVTSENYICPSSTLLSPLGEGSRNASAARQWAIEESRFDVANTSIRLFREDFASIALNDLIDAMGYRFNCKPWAMRGTAGDSINMGDEMALTVPFVQRGVSQFVIEFAGDFITQNADGTTKLFQPDNEIDYVLIPDPAKSGNYIKQVRWYGMPRNVDKQNDINGRPRIPAGGVDAVRSADVLPLRDLLPTSPAAAVKQGKDILQGIERFEFRNPNSNNNAAGQTVPKVKDYATQPDKGGSMLAVYECGWNSDDLNNPAIGKPTMIRLVMTLTDANGRLPEGQTVEYVYTLKQ